MVAATGLVTVFVIVIALNICAINIANITVIVITLNVTVINSSLSILIKTSSVLIIIIIRSAHLALWAPLATLDPPAFVDLPDVWLLENKHLQQIV